MSLKLDGKKLSLEIEERLNDYISTNKKIAKRVPGLAVIRIGEDPASGVYVNNKEKACSRVGIKSFIFHLKDNVEQKEVEQLINKLNFDNDIDGILLQLPIPKNFDDQRLISCCSSNFFGIGSCSNIPSISLSKFSLFSNCATSFCFTLSFR